MQHLTAGTRVDIDALSGGRFRQVLTFSVRGREVMEHIPPDLQLWAVRTGGDGVPGVVLTWGPGGPGVGETRGEPGAVGVVLDLDQLLGRGAADDPRTDCQVVLVAVGPARTGAPLNFEVRCQGRLVARAPVPEGLPSTAGHQTAIVLGRLYHRQGGRRLWVQVEPVGDAGALEKLLNLPAHTFLPRRPRQNPPAAVPSGPAAQRPEQVAPAPSIPPRQPAEAGRPDPSPGALAERPGGAGPQGGPLAWLAEAWVALRRRADPEGPEGPTPDRPPVSPRPASAVTLAPRTAAALAALEVRLDALEAAAGEEEAERAAEGFLLSPEQARRRARLASLRETLRRVISEATALSRRTQRLSAARSAAGDAKPQAIVDVENAIENAVRALSAAIDQEAWAITGGPLAQSRARLQSEAKFLEDLQNDGRLS